MTQCGHSMLLTCMAFEIRQSAVHDSGTQIGFLVCTRVLNLVQLYGTWKLVQARAGPGQVYGRKLLLWYFTAAHVKRVLLFLNK